MCSSIPSTVLGLTITALVSNIPDQAISFDPNLSIPWGIIVDGDLIWVANSRSGIVTIYDRLGTPMLPFVTVFGTIGQQLSPTGIALNRTDGYVVRNGPVRYPSQLLICTREGTINGYNELVDPENSRLLVRSEACYTGIAVSRLVYVTDFLNRKIDTFDGILRPVNLPFIDSNSFDPIPPNYSPYNITLIGDFLYVSYAPQDPLENQYALPGVGHGYVSIFDLFGRFVRRFTSKGVLNCPWAVLPIPSTFGYPSGSIAIGNFGSGLITVHDIDGNYLDTMRAVDQNPIYLGGLHGLCSGSVFDRALYWASTQAGISEAFVGNIVIHNDFFIG